VPEVAAITDFAAFLSEASGDGLRVASGTGFGSRLEAA